MIEIALIARKTIRRDELMIWRRYRRRISTAQQSKPLNTLKRLIGDSRIGNRFLHHASQMPPNVATVVTAVQ